MILSCEYLFIGGGSCTRSSALFSNHSYVCLGDGYKNEITNQDDTGFLDSLVGIKARVNQGGEWTVQRK